ncbi:glutamate--tRNA ligase [Candidatus Kaiserbacteria bacterium]|nr:glutamate--tRNA ligase [Candidatus Kaiserbacteria bacterium]
MFGRKKPKVVTRMAPSPTGHLHIGTARTALYNFLYARQHDGIFLMRSEDTDKKRSTPEYEREITDGLAWLGLEWDGYCRQSERTDIYTHHIEQLLTSQKAYISSEASKQNPGETVEVIRLRNPNTTITFEDAVRGEISFDTTELGDFVIARSKTDPVYHLAVVVDDHDMGVTHIIRGEDHISNTPRQILIQEAIGAERPVYAHAPLLLAPDRSKLSKRHGAVALDDYIQAGYLAEALVNYLALLGWNPGTNQEIFSLEELVQSFDLAGIQKGGAIFDSEKLKWYNKEHLKNLTEETYYEMVLARMPERVRSLSQYSEERVHRLLPTLVERTAVAEEITEAAEAGEYDFAFAYPELNLELIRWKNDTSPKDSLPRLQHLAEIVSRMPEDVSSEDAKEAIWEYAEEKGKGEVLWPLRVVLTGQERSPDPFTVISVIGSAEAYDRLRKACDALLAR